MAGPQLAAAEQRGPEPDRRLEYDGRRVRGAGGSGGADAELAGVRQAVVDEGWTWGRGDGERAGGAGACGYAAREGSFWRGWERVIEDIEGERAVKVDEIAVLFASIVGVFGRTMGGINTSMFFASSLDLSTPSNDDGRYRGSD